jgi:cytoskeletal protein RodZ
MGQIGEALRKAREEQGFSLAQAEEVTKIRAAYLQALEEESFAQLPGPVYVKGFLKNYAQYLGLDPQPLLSLYEAPELPVPNAPATAALNEPLQPRNLRRFVRPLSLALLVIVAVTAVWWSYQRYYAVTPLAQPTPTPTVAATTVPATPTETPLPPTETVARTATATRTVTLTPTPVGLVLSIEIVGQRSWILVQTDGERAFAGILEPGARDSWTAREYLSLRSGNAGAVRIQLNGQDLGLFGDLGQVLEKEWTAPGIPTRTPTPTAGA